jgi:hypothetical protein
MLTPRGNHGRLPDAGHLRGGGDPVRGVHRTWAGTLRPCQSDCPVRDRGDSRSRFHYGNVPLALGLFCIAASAAGTAATVAQVLIGVAGGTVLVAVGLNVMIGVVGFDTTSVAPGARAHRSGPVHRRRPRPLGVGSRLRLGHAALRALRVLGHGHPEQCWGCALGRWRHERRACRALRAHPRGRDRTPHWRRCAATRRNRRRRCLHPTPSIRRW